MKMLNQRSAKLGKHLSKNGSQALLMFALFGAPATRGLALDNWTNVDEFLYQSGTNNWGQAITRAPDGSLLAAGIAKDQNQVYHGLVRHSIDGGYTWTVIDDFAPTTSSGTGCEYYGIGIDAKGTIYVTGVLILNAQDREWLVRRSTDGGATFKWADQVSQGSANGVVVGPDGTVYVTGSIYGGAGPGATRKSIDGGYTWVPSDPFLMVGQAIAADTMGNIYAAGYSLGSKGAQNAFIVRMLTPGANTWITIDNYLLYRSAGAQADAISVGADGAVFAAGNATDKNGKAHWVVRKRAFGQSNFVTVDDYKLTSGSAWAFTISPSGRLFAAGQAIDAAGVFHWTTRKSLDNGATWSTSDDDPFDGIYRPFAITTDVNGNLVTAGVQHSATDQPWVTRVMTP